MLTGIDGGETEIGGLALGEEIGRVEDRGNDAWVITPIDKTKPFIRGLTCSRASRWLMRGRL